MYKWIFCLILLCANTAYANLGHHEQINYSYNEVAKFMDKSLITSKPYFVQKVLENQTPIDIYQSHGNYTIIVFYDIKDSTYQIDGLLDSDYIQHERQFIIALLNSFQFNKIRITADNVDKIEKCINDVINNNYGVFYSDVLNKTYYIKKEKINNLYIYQYDDYIIKNVYKYSIIVK